MTREFTAVIEKRGKWYVAWIEEVPGVNTQGRTLAEVRRNLKDALEGILALNREMASKEKEKAEEVRREPILVEV
jgi:predicted RNase H-like HicB family nuclease